MIKPIIKITGEGRFTINTKGNVIEYQFYGCDNDKCSVFAAPIKHAFALKVCPYCLQELRKV